VIFVRNEMTGWKIYAQQIIGHWLKQMHACSFMQDGTGVILRN
jgi:hypothetical protein